MVNIVYAFFDTFGVIDATTAGRAGQGHRRSWSTRSIDDGFVGLDLGGSSAQSVILMVIVIALTVVQFRFVERKVHY